MAAKRPDEAPSRAYLNYTDLWSLTGLCFLHHNGTDFRRSERVIYENVFFIVPDIFHLTLDRISSTVYGLPSSRRVSASTSFIPFLLHVSV